MRQRQLLAEAARPPTTANTQHGRRIISVRLPAFRRRRAEADQHLWNAGGETGNRHWGLVHVPDGTYPR
jgi:hypothetical protein